MGVTIEQIREYKRKYKRSAKGKASERRYVLGEKGRASIARKNRKYRLGTTKKARLEAIAHYGGRCSECGSEEELQIDHIGGGGHTHRNNEPMARDGRIGLWLKKRGFPPGFRVLCATCNKRDFHHNQRYQRRMA